MTWSVIGFPKQKKYMEQLLKRKELPHALLFSGPEMIGKKLFAHDLYRLANGRESLRDIDADLKLLAPQFHEDETKIYIEAIREARSFLSLKPSPGPYKFLIIDDADRMTPEASNALLKVLEEPPAHSVIVLVTSRPRALVPTIISRCQTVRFLPQTDDEVSNVIARWRLPTGQAGPSDAETAFVVSSASGRIGWAMRMQEPDALAHARRAVHDFQLILTKSIAERFVFAKKLTDQKDYQNVISSWLWWAHGALRRGDLAPRTVSELIRLHYILSQPQYNHRLALEDFLMNI